MDRDASLDEFLDAEASDDDPSEQDTEESPEQDGSPESVDSDEASGETVDTEATSDQSNSVEPARSTGRWDPEGAVCDACGAAVTRRWREDEAFRCVECKSW